jgi:hypothetical protein
VKTRTEIDPELHVLRSVARHCEGRQGQELESARFNLFRAFEDRQPQVARRWAAAIRVAVLLIDNEQVREMGLLALRDIDVAIEGGA